MVESDPVTDGHFGALRSVCHLVYIHMHEHTLAAKGTLFWRRRDRFHAVNVSSVCLVRGKEKKESRK